MTRPLNQAIAALRALPRVDEVQVETGIGIFPEVEEREDGRFLRFDDVDAVLRRHEAAPSLWIDVRASLPPAVDALTGYSAQYIVATDEATDGQAFAYLRHSDDEPPRWITACSNSWRLERVTHYRPLLELPDGCGARCRRSADPMSGVPA